MSVENTDKHRSEAARQARIDLELQSINSKMDELLQESRGFNGRIAENEKDIAVMKMELSYIRRLPRMALILLGLAGTIGGGSYYAVQGAAVPAARASK